MQQTYQLNTENLNTAFLETVKAAFGKKDIKIVIEEVQSEGEQEALFISLFGSWQGDKTGDELVDQIDSARVSGTREVDL